ncbi:MAG: anthranilate phosphoribosyltransferase [Deinococcota bacterium]
MPEAQTTSPTTPLDIAALLNSLFAGETLDQAKAEEVLGALMDGAMSQMQAAALLAALRTRGETVDEIVGFAKAMRTRAVKVPTSVQGVLLDTCGTGGTGFNSFNISTACLFVIAAAGVKIAKHGNRAATRPSGAADVLEALGATVGQSPEHLARSLESVGLTFIFARSHHPAMKFVGPIRADLKARTVFNVLGPLTNPAGANRQLLGVYDPNLTETMAQVLAGLGVERALVVHGDGLDELTVTGENIVSELVNGEVTTSTLTPEDFGFQRYSKDDLLGGSPSENAATIRGILQGEVTGAKRAIVMLNAGAALYLADKADSIRQGAKLAAQLIDDGSAGEKLEQYINFNKA